MKKARLAPGLVFLVADGMSVAVVLGLERAGLLHADVLRLGVVELGQLGVQIDRDGLAGGGFLDFSLFGFFLRVLRLARDGQLDGRRQ